MATTDYTDLSSPCVCGKGTITVTQASPDHPWVTAGQITYSAEIDCDACRQKFAVRQDHGRFPYLVSRDDLQAFATAKEERLAADRAIVESEAANVLIGRIAAAVDAKSSMAAKHRELQRLGLAYESLGTYRKRPYSGSHAAGRASGHSLARVGSMAEYGGDDMAYFRKALSELELLEKNERSLEPRPVTTGARWLKA